MEDLELETNKLLWMCRHFSVSFQFSFTGAASDCIVCINTPEATGSLTVVNEVVVTIKKEATQYICSAATIMTTFCHWKPLGIHIKRNHKHHRDFKTSIFLCCTRKTEEAVKDIANCWHTFFLREEGGEWKLCSTEKTRCQCKNRLPVLELVQLWAMSSQGQEP